MNPDYEKRLEAEIDRDLKRLPDLAAPVELSARVMRAIGQPKQAAWYERPWDTWPIAFRVTGLAVLLSAFCVACLVAWQLPYGQYWTSATTYAAHWLAPVAIVWQTCESLGVVFLAAGRSLGTDVLIVWVFAAASVYALFIGLGAAAFKYAYSRR